MLKIFKQLLWIATEKWEGDSDRHDNGRSTRVKHGLSVCCSARQCHVTASRRQREDCQRVRGLVQGFWVFRLPSGLLCSQLAFCGHGISQIILHLSLCMLLSDLCFCHLRWVRASINITVSRCSTIVIVAPIIITNVIITITGTWRNFVGSFTLMIRLYLFLIL